jgi:metacaspase-1
MELQKWIILLLGFMGSPERGNSVNRIGMSLSIGVNYVDPEHYEGWTGALRACENDARAMSEIARAEGFETVVLLSAEARSERVFEEIRRAARRLRAGDSFVLSFAGHGSQIRDAEAEEDDGLDETWVLHDRMVADDEVRAVLDEFRTGVRVALVVDSCHSASSDRLGPPASGGRPRLMPPALSASVYLQHQAPVRRLAGQCPPGGSTDDGLTH